MLTSTEVHANFTSVIFKLIICMKQLKARYINWFILAKVWWYFKVLTFLRVDVSYMFASEFFQLGQVQKKKPVKASLKNYTFFKDSFNQIFRFHIQIIQVYSSVCFMFYLIKVYFRLFYFFLSAVLVDLVYWVMMDGHATTQECCIIYLAITLFSLTHVMKWRKLFFFLQMEQ